MRRCQPLPSLWLITDERADALLDAALLRLPRGSGVVFRHHATAAPARRARFEEVRRIARRRRLVLVLAGPPGLAVAWRADGAHGRSRHRSRPRRLLRTGSAHCVRDLARGFLSGVDLMFLSPVFPTRSHPAGATLGPLGFGTLAGLARMPVIALGGMTEARYRRIKPLGASGWAAIDALSAPADQKRKVVPR